MRPLNIWVDCDGVLADFMGLYLSILREHTGRAHSREEATSFDLTSCVASADEDNYIWRYIDANPGLVRKMALVSGAREGLESLRKLGTVRALTAPHFGPTWMPERARWLQSVGFGKKEIVFCSHKALIPGDVLIEDNHETCEAWRLAHPKGIAILFDAPHNQGPTNCVRAHGWNALVNYLYSETADRCEQTQSMAAVTL